MHGKIKLTLALTLTALLLGGCMQVPDDLPTLANSAPTSAVSVTDA